VPDERSTLTTRPKAVARARRLIPDKGSDPVHPAEAAVRTIH